MQGIPSNNDYSHLPWFHYDPQKGTEADVGLTIRLAKFILKYAESGSDIYQKAVALIARYEPDGQAAIPDFTDYDTTSWEPWNPTPVIFVGSPDSEHYPGLKHIVDIQLDMLVDKLHHTNELKVSQEEEIVAWEKNFPRADGKRWSDNEQIAGSFFWVPGGFIYELEILRPFGRLDFQIPVQF